MILTPLLKRLLDYQQPAAQNFATGRGVLLYLSIKTPVLRHLLLLTSLLLTALANILSAQDVFELTYQFKGDPSKTVYNGFLVSNKDGTGFLRLSSASKTSKRVLYDFTLYTKSFDNINHPLEGALVLEEEGTDTYHYCWSENFSLKEGTEIFDFDYLRLWFRLNSQKKILEPVITTPFNANGRNKGITEAPTYSRRKAQPDSSGVTQQEFTETGILSVKQLTSATFTKAYLQQYFLTTELIYEGAYTKSQVIKVRSNVMPVMYVISVVNTGDADIKATCIEDGKNVTGYFRKVSALLNLPIVIEKVDGANFSKAGVLKAISRIKPKVKKDDIVIFHYSGHGFRYKEDKLLPFPRMFLRYGDSPNRVDMYNSSMNLEDIFKSIQAMGGRLNLIMSDCCNTEISIRRDQIYDTAKASYPPGYYDMNKRPAASLFLQSKGSYIISAAEPGQPARCSTTYNGLFTTSIIHTILMELKRNDAKVEWVDIIRKAQKKTEGLAFLYQKEQDMIFRGFTDTKAKTPFAESIGGSAVKQTH